MTPEWGVKELLKWEDEVPRSGPENMAVDQWLLETVRAPILRVYRWKGEWGSCGYFVKSIDADAALRGTPWVRRWTGGGIVDHRSDWTYTLAIPRDERLATARGAESYRIIHAALATAMNRSGVSLSGHQVALAGGKCFDAPVEHDLLDSSGRKLAGAGQRRCRFGLLHQGSVTEAPDSVEIGRFAAAMAESVKDVELLPDAVWVDFQIKHRFAQTGWNRRR